MTSLRKLREQIEWRSLEPSSPSPYHPPSNKYEVDPNHNSRAAWKEKYALPTPETYKAILAKQEKESTDRKKDFEEKMARAIERDKKAAKKRNQLGT